MNKLKLIALYAICTHYHSGQWSRGYLGLCKISARLKARYNVLYPLDHGLTYIEYRIAQKYYKQYEKNKPLINSL